MSDEKVERSLLITDAFNRGDVESTVALLDEGGVWYLRLKH
jgi:hypothetical protein